MELSKHDVEVLRRLGQEYMSFATLPVQKQKTELWKALNRSEMQRPMVCIDQIPFTELCDAHPEDLTCVVENAYFRQLEDSLRKQIYQWKHFPADMVLEPFIRLPSCAEISDYGLQPQVERKTVPGTAGADSQKYTATITKLSDVDLILDRTVRYDPVLEADAFETAKDIFAGIADVKKSHGVTFHLGVWDQLVCFLGGPEEVMYLFYDDPELLHAAMRRVTDATIAAIDEANRLRQVDDVATKVHCSYVFNDKTLPDFDRGLGSTSEYSWAFGMAQLFDSTSPEFMEEFELPYISEMAAKFGNLYYGCCDRLDDRLDLYRRAGEGKRRQPRTDPQGYLHRPPSPRTAGSVEQDRHGDRGTLLIRRKKRISEQKLRDPSFFVQLGIRNEEFLFLNSASRKELPGSVIFTLYATATNDAPSGEGYQRLDNCDAILSWLQSITQ